MGLASAGSGWFCGGMTKSPESVCEVEVGELGERLLSLRLLDRRALVGMQRSFEAHGQLTPIVVFAEGAQLEIIDGFKRAHAARMLGWPRVWATVASVGSIEAKLRLRALHQGQGLTELEEAWLVRALHREDGLGQPEIARLLSRHKSWVWRRLMLVESLEPIVQNDVRLGLLAPRTAVAVSRLPRGNQKGASDVVMRRGLTVRQTELLVDALRDEPDDAARAALLALRLDGPVPWEPPGPRASRAQSEADRLSTDVIRLRDVALRVDVALRARPLETYPEAASELLTDALRGVLPILRRLDAALEHVVAGSVNG